MMEAVGISSLMTALAQPNQSGVSAGLLSIVQSWTWVNEAAPAIRPTAVTMSTRTPVWMMSALRRLRAGLLSIVDCEGIVMRSVLHGGMGGVGRWPGGWSQWH